MNMESHPTIIFPKEKAKNEHGESSHDHFTQKTKNEHGESSHDHFPKRKSQK